MADPVKRRGAGSRSPVAEEACERFKESSEALSEQRKAILKAKQFRAGKQWEDAVLEQRQGAPAIAGVSAEPMRPCLTIDRISQPVRQVSNTIRQSNFEIDCLPTGDGADKDTAEIYKGWMRRVQNESRGDAPIEWAADSAAEGGLGWVKLTAYCTETDDKFPFDQDLRIDRVVNTLSVYPDPFATKPTRSDMNYLLQTQDLPRFEFKQKFGADKLGSLDEFQADGDSGGWVTDDTVRIAEYWRVEYTDVRIVELNNGTALIGDAIPDGAKKGDKPKDIKRERVRRSPSVKWSKVTAMHELEATDWLGTRIPYAPVLGEELNVDGKPVLRGVIEPAMDAQRMVNYTFSAAIESAALAPKSPWLIAEGQTDGYKAIWQTANTKNHAYLPYKPTSMEGQNVQPPQRNTVEQPIGAFVELMGQAEEAVKATTGIFDPSLGNSNPRERSGTAIKALTNQSDLGQSNYQDNTMRAVIYLGELMVELGPKILDRPGRIIQILQLDDTPNQVMLGQPFLPPTAPNQPPQPVMQSQPAQGQAPQPVTDPTHPDAVAAMQAGIAKFYDLKNGKYGVVVNVGRDHTTKRQETNSALGELIPHLPPPMQAVLTPEYIETLDFKDSQKIADIARKALPPELQAAESGQQPGDPRDKAQIAHLNAALQQAKQIIDTKQVEQQGKIAQVRMEGTKDLLLAHVNNAAKIQVVYITASKEHAMADNENQLEFAATGIQLSHEAQQNELDRRHEAAMSAMQHAQELQQGTADAGNQAVLADQSQGHALEQNQQQADLQPPPQEAAAP